MPPTLPVVRRPSARPSSSSSSSRGRGASRAAALLLLAAAVAIAAACGSRGVATAPPEDTAFRQTGTRTAPATLGPGMARFWTQATAEYQARQLLRRHLLLHDADLERMVRTDEFYRVALDSIVRRAPIVLVAYDADTRTCVVTVEADPVRVAADLADARRVRAAHGLD